MSKPVYHRQSRTSSSEQYHLMDGETSLGHLDLHFGATEVWGTLVLDREVNEVEAAKLVEQIDEDLVLSAEVPREDFFVRVYVGKEIALYSDDLMADGYAADGHEELGEEEI